MTNSVNPDQTAPIGSMLYASILNSSVMLDNYFQQHTTFSDAFFFLALRWLMIKIPNIYCLL